MSIYLEIFCGGREAPYGLVVKPWLFRDERIPDSFCHSLTTVKRSPILCASRRVSKNFECHSRPTTTTNKLHLLDCCSIVILFQSVVVQKLCWLLLQFFVVSSRCSWIGGLCRAYHDLLHSICGSLDVYQKRSSKLIPKSPSQWQ